MNGYFVIVLPSFALMDGGATVTGMDSAGYFIYIALFALALIATLALTPVASRLAWRFGAIDYPSGRRVNVKPTPRMGGIAVMCGLIVSFGGCFALSHVFGWPALPSSGLQQSIWYPGVAASIFIMFLVGAIDDVWDMMAHTKFIWQLVAACMATAFGVVVGSVVNPLDGSVVELGWLAYPITVIYLVSFANIINLIDGVDGLASGITVTIGLALFAVSVMGGHLDAAALAVALVGAALGFLKWNFSPAKIFLGDSGSLLLGFCLGIASLMGNVQAAGLTELLVPIVMAGVPILDTFAAIVRRARVGVSIGTPDKGHVHHRLLKRGYGQRAVAAIVCAWTLMLCLCAIAITQMDVIMRVILFLVLPTACFLGGMYLNVFVPVVRNRFDPETGLNEIVPIGEEDYSSEEISAAILGGVDARVSNHDDLEKTARPLRILAVSQHYWPEPFAIPDVCEGLVAMGHDVTVLTGTPNYPDGDIYAGYEHGAQVRQHRNGVRIIRAKIVPRGREMWQRVVNYYSYSISASRIARDMGPGFDVVLSFQTTPVMMARPALAYGKKYGVPVLLWCQDLWPESLTVGGIKRSSFIYWCYARASRKIYSSADMLAVSSRSFADYYEKELGMDVQPLYLPQYAEDIFNQDAPLRDEYDPEKINLSFAGNVGAAQAANTFVEAGHYLAQDSRFALHVVGSGSELETLMKYKDEIGADCVTFHGRFPLNEMPSFYDSSDAMVATFKDNPILGYTLPRKIVSYMAAGRPILGTVNGEAREIIEEAGCGFCCDAEDPVALAEACRKFADLTSAEREKMGERGRIYYEQHFSKHHFFATLEVALQKLKGSKHGG